MSETPDNTGQIPDAMPPHTEHFSSDDLPATQDNRPHTCAQNTCSTMANVKNQAGTPETVVDDTLSRGQGDDSGILTDPGHAAQDAKLVRRSLRCGWNIPDAAKPRIVNRLVKIVDDNPDDGDAIKAASVLRSMDAQDQDADIKAIELERIDSGKATQAVQLYGREAPIEAV